MHIYVFVGTETMDAVPGYLLKRTGGFASHSFADDIRTIVTINTDGVFRNFAVHELDPSRHADSATFVHFSPFSLYNSDISFTREKRKVVVLG